MSLVRFRPEAPHSADLAHLVERHLAKVEVAGSSPVIRSIHGHEKRARFSFKAKQIFLLLLFSAKGFEFIRKEEGSRMGLPFPIPN